MQHSASAPLTASAVQHVVLQDRLLLSRATCWSWLSNSCSPLMTKRISWQYGAEQDCKIGQCYRTACCCCFLLGMLTTHLSLGSTMCSSTESLHTPMCTRLKAWRLLSRNEPCSIKMSWSLRRQAVVRQAQVLLLCSKLQSGQQLNWPNLSRSLDGRV